MMESDKLRNILNIVFIVLTLMVVVAYFTIADRHRTLFIALCFAAIFIKMVEVCLRCIKKK